MNKKCGVTGCAKDATATVYWGANERLSWLRCRGHVDSIRVPESYRIEYFNTRGIHAGDMATRDSGKLDALVAQLQAGDEVEAWWNSGEGMRGSLEEHGDSLTLGGCGWGLRDHYGTYEDLVELRVLKLAAGTVKPAYSDAPGVIVNTGFSTTIWKRHELGWMSSNGVTWSNETAEQHWRNATVVPITDAQAKELFA